MLSGVRGWVSGVVGLGVVLCCLVLSAGALAVGDATTGNACLNEASPGFRSYLPECRAYELVTPVFKDGNEVEVNWVSEDGLGWLGQALGGFAGVESDTEAHGAYYLLSRTGSGWVVSAVSPPASRFPAQLAVAASPELGETLWFARTPSQSIAAEDLYVREADGTMVKIGPLVPPSAEAGPPAGEFTSFQYFTNFLYDAAADDFSHVFFDIHGGLERGLLWPGDKTLGIQSLYEYSGREAVRPELVGVNGEGQLISKCETLLGSLNSTDLYNAVSADGERAYFTAVGHNFGGCFGSIEAPGVSELWVRLGGVESLPISEPSAFQCEVCETGVRAPAEFAGASRDGSRVFFLTEQELFAGAAGMNLYEYDLEGTVGAHVARASVTVGPAAADVQGVARVSEDGSHVYFVAHGRLTKLPRQGGCAEELTAGEKIEEEEAEKEENEKSGEAVKGGKCRPKEGGDNLYVYAAGRVSFIATLCSAQEESGSLAHVAQCPSAGSDAEDWGPEDERLVQATPDGRFLVFDSVGHLTEGNVGGSEAAQVFEYDAVTGELVRLSRGSSRDEVRGTESADENEAHIPLQKYSGQDVSPTNEATRLGVSDDGSVVVFGSAGALVEEAEGAAGAGAESVYEYHSAVAEGGAISDGDVYLISDGVNVLNATLEGLDASGQDVFFLTSDSLVPQDTDTQFDTYDARAGGGFPAPDPPAGCQAQACASGLSEQLPAVTPASALAAGAGGPPLSSPPGSVVPGKSKRVVLSRAQRLARALGVCRREPRRLRIACEAMARKRYGPLAKKVTRHRRGK